MRTHRPGNPKFRLLLAAVLGVSTLGLGSCGGPATVPLNVSAAAQAVPAAQQSPPRRACVPIRPERGFYEGGRVATEDLTTPDSRCRTISVSHVVDAADPADRCQTFLIGFWPLVDGSLTYTEPVTACGARRTVLARNVPDGTRYLVLYAVDYIDPQVQRVEFTVWH